MNGIPIRTQCSPYIIRERSITSMVWEKLKIDTQILSDPSKNKRTKPTLATATQTHPLPVRLLLSLGLLVRVDAPLARGGLLTAPVVLEERGETVLKTCDVK